MEDKEVKGYCFDNFKVDKEKSEEGVWIAYANGFRIKMTRVGCPAYKEYMASRLKVHARGAEDSDISDDLVKDAMAETIIKDWENLLDGEKKQIPYSKETARQLLDVPGDFYEEMFGLAKGREHFKIDQTNEIAGN